jgi:phage-related protein
MKKIDSKFILVLLSIISFLSISYIFNSKNDLIKKELEIKNLKAMTEEINTLKKHWQDPKKSRKELDSLVKQLKQKRIKVITSISKNIYTIKIESIENKRMNFFVKKLLTNSFVIHDFYTIRLNNHQASLLVKVKI